MKWHLGFSASDVIPSALKSWHSLSSNQPKVISEKNTNSDLETWGASAKYILWGLPGEPFARCRQVEFFKGLYNPGSLYSIIYLEVQKTQRAASGLDSMTKLRCAILSVIIHLLFWGEKHHTPASISIISTDDHMLSLFLLIVAFQRSEHFLKPFQQDYNILFFFRYNLAISIPTNARKLCC